MLLLKILRFNWSITDKERFVFEHLNAEHGLQLLYFRTNIMLQSSYQPDTVAALLARRLKIVITEPDIRTNIQHRESPCTPETD